MSIVTHLAGTENAIFSASTDGVLKRSERIPDSSLFEVKFSVKLEGSPIDMKLGNDDLVYVLLSN